MRPFSFSIDRSANFRPRPDSGVGPTSVAAYARSDPRRRRLEDAVEDVFHAALRHGDLASAEELLGVIEGMATRHRLGFRGERRSTRAMIERARGEMAARRMKYRAGPG